MYIKEKLVKFLKIRNAILSFVGVFTSTSSLYVMISLLNQYWGDWFTIKHARATPECVFWIIAGTIMAAAALWSHNRIRDAYFYSSYFEGDLDGMIDYSELTAITGKSVGQIRRQLYFFRKTYMKGFTFHKEDKTERLELDSKKCTCECRKCGAVIEKKVYFTGECPYCKSSDLSARVLTGNRFYSIRNEQSSESGTPQFYLLKKLRIRKGIYAGLLCFGLFVSIIMLLYAFDEMGHLNDKEYLTELLLSGTTYLSYERIKMDMVDSIMWAMWAIAACIPLNYNMITRLSHIFTAERCAEFFAYVREPFVNASKLPGYSKKRGIRSVKAAICRHYLLNCSFVKRGRGMNAALARKIVKDECPNCGASIVGAVDEKYKCRYCGSMIMDVVQKK